MTPISTIVRYSSLTRIDACTAPASCRGNNADFIGYRIVSNLIVVRYPSLTRPHAIRLTHRNGRESWKQGDVSGIVPRDIKIDDISMFVITRIDALTAPDSRLAKKADLSVIVSYRTWLSFDIYHC